MSLSLQDFRPLPPLLVCADLQGDELGPDMRGRCDDTLDKCRRLMAHWRSRHWPLLHLKRIARASWFDLSHAGSDWMQDFRPLPGELTFEHALPSAYSSSRFVDYMRNVRPETSIMVGLSLDQTILSSAIDGFHRGYRHQVVADAVDTTRQPPSSRETLVTVLSNFSSTIQTSGLLRPDERAERTGESRK